MNDASLSLNEIIICNRMMIQLLIGSGNLG